MKRNTFQSKYLLAAGSACTAVLIGLRHLGFLPLGFHVQSVTNGIMLVVLGAVILSSFLREREKRKADESALHFTLSDVIALTLTVPAIGLGIAEILDVQFTGELSGVIGILYVVLSVVMLFGVIKES